MHFSVGDHKLTSRTNWLPKWFKYPLADEERHVTLLVYAISSCNTLSMLTSTVLWQVCSQVPRWYLFKQLERRLEMTSWHETCPRWQVWQAAKLQVGGGAGSSYVRWSNIPGIVENIRNISFTLPLPLCNIICRTFPMQKKVVRFLILKVFLWNLSWGAPAELQHVKWSSEIKFHWPAWTWFPLSPHSLSQLLSSLYTFQELMDCGCMEDIIYYPNTLCFCSLYCTAPA